MYLLQQNPMRSLPLISINTAQRSAYHGSSEDQKRRADPPSFLLATVNGQSQGINVRMKLCTSCIYCSRGQIDGLEYKNLAKRYEFCRCIRNTGDFFRITCCSSPSRNRAVRWLQARRRSAQLLQKQLPQRSARGSPGQQSEFRAFGAR